MIVTLTPNPSVDRTVELSSLRRGEVNRAVSARHDPGGKGLNVSRALTLHGVPTTAVLPIGGHSGRLMLDLIAEASVSVRPVPVVGSIRANVALVEPNGTTTKVNELGPTLSTDEASALVQAARDALDAPGWVVGCGSLPRGVPSDFYARLADKAHGWGARVAIDASGEALSAALRTEVDLVKPNRIELAEVVGCPLATAGEVIAAARDLIAGGVGEVLVSLGRDGALLVTDQNAMLARAEGILPVSTVGAGDSLLAGYLAARSRGADDVEALSLATAFGAAAVALPGSQMPNPAQVVAVSVTCTDSIDPSLPLAD